MLNSPTPTNAQWIKLTKEFIADPDLFKLCEEILTDPVNKETAKTVSEAELEQVLQKIYSGEQQVFKDPLLQKDAAFAKKAFEHFLQKTIESSSLVDTNKNNLLALISRYSNYGYNKQIPNNQDWLKLTREFIGDADVLQVFEKLLEAPAIKATAKVLSTAELERVLQKVYTSDQRVFKNPDMQKDAVYARKAFDYYLRGTIESAALEDAQKSQFLALLNKYRSKYNDSKGLIASIYEQVKEAKNFTGKLDSFMLNIKALIVGGGRLLVSLQHGLFGKKVSSADVPPPLPARPQVPSALVPPPPPDAVVPPPLPPRPTRGSGASKSRETSNTASIAAALNSKPVVQTPPTDKQEESVANKGSVRSKASFFEQLTQQQPPQNKSRKQPMPRISSRAR